MATVNNTTIGDMPLTVTHYWVANGRHGEPLARIFYHVNLAKQAFERLKPQHPKACIMQGTAFYGDNERDMAEYLQDLQRVERDLALLREVSA